MKKKFAPLALLAVSALIFTACGGDESNDAAEDVIDISGVWARTSPAMTSRGAVYMIIAASAADELLSASVDVSIAGSVEIHESASSGTSGNSMLGNSMPMSDMPMSDMPMSGMSDEMIMREVSSIMIPTGQTVRLMPGGLHIMLIDLVAPLKLGQTFEVTLTFANAGTVIVIAEVRDDAP